MVDSATGAPLSGVQVTALGASDAVGGADASLTATLTSHFEVSGTYSWASRNVAWDVDVVGTIVLNVPKNKGSMTLRYRHERPGFTAALQGRAVEGFPVTSGVFVARIESYAVIDLHVGYQPPLVPGATISLDAHNLFDHRHREFVGAPKLGRLVVSKVQVRL